VIGFLAGLAVALAAMILIQGRARHQAVAAPAASSALPRPARRAEPVTRREPPPQSASPSTDEQVAEDAAAAGMTSRSRKPPGQ
jgi:hypothetical protein